MDVPDFILADAAEYLTSSELLVFLEAVNGLIGGPVRHELIFDQQTPIDVVGTSLTLRKQAKRLHVERLHLGFYSIQANCYPVLRLLHLLPSLRCLSLAGIELSSAGVKALEGPALASLEELDVSHCLFIGAGSGVAKQPPAFSSNLRKLGFVSTSLARRWQLECFSSLRSFSGKFMDPAAAADLAQCKQLRELELHGTRVCSLRIEGAAWRSVLSGLHSLSFYDCDLLPRPHLQQQPWDVLGEIVELAPHLSSLTLVGTPQPPIDDQLLDQVLPLLSGRVKRAISGAHSHSSNASDEQPQYSLSYGYASDPAYGTEEGGYIAGPRDNVRHGRMHDLAEAVAADRKCGTSNVGFTHLTIQPSTLLTDRSLRLIGECIGPTLTSLCLGPYNPLITDAGLSSVAELCPRLNRLHLPFSSQITDVGARALAAAARKRPGQLQDLNLNRCGIMSASTLLSLASACTGLKDLHIRGCHAAVNDACSSIVEAAYFGAAGSDAAASLAMSPDSTSHVISGQDVLRSLRSRGCRVYYLPHPSHSSHQASSANSMNAGQQSPMLKTSTVTDCGDGGGPDSPSSNRIPCPHGCGAEVKPADVSDHAQVCLQVEVPCVNAAAGCGFRASRGDIPAFERHFAACPHWTVSCSAGCGEVLHASQLEGHLLEHVRCVEGAALQQRCPMAAEGCAYSRRATIGDGSADAFTGSGAAPLSMEEHISSGACCFAAYACASCGKTHSSADGPVTIVVSQPPQQLLLQGRQPQASSPTSQEEDGSGSAVAVPAADSAEAAPVSESTTSAADVTAASVPEPVSVGGTAPSTGSSAICTSASQSGASSSPSPIGASALVRHRWASCSTSECAAAALSRAALFRSASDPADHNDSPFPPPTLLKGIPPALLHRYSLVPAPPPPAPSLLLQRLASIDSGFAYSYAGPASGSDRLSALSPPFIPPSVRLDPATLAHPQPPSPHRSSSSHSVPAPEHDGKSGLLALQDDAGSNASDASGVSTFNSLHRLSVDLTADTVMGGGRGGDHRPFLSEALSAAVESKQRNGLTMELAEVLAVLEQSLRGAGLDAQGNAIPPSAITPFLSMSATTANPSAAGTASIPSATGSERGAFSFFAPNANGDSRRASFIPLPVRSLERDSSTRSGEIGVGTEGVTVHPMSAANPAPSIAPYVSSGSTAPSAARGDNLSQSGEVEAVGFTCCWFRRGKKKAKGR